MDRFIESHIDVMNNFDSYLKSNMDRFIVYMIQWLCDMYYNLKSNMDRFIETPQDEPSIVFLIFKIQYG